ncbi:MAG: MBL fold metallo-hydrolase, partial [Chitinophagaceae bacterium]
MHRRIFLQNSIATAAALSLGSQQILKAMSIDPWKITMLNDSLGIFTEKGGTIAFHYSTDGLTIVDAQFPDSAAHLISELKKKKDSPYHLLINTHHHGDHTAGNIAFKDLVSRVLAHENSLANQQRVAEAQQT